MLQTLSVNLISRSSTGSRQDFEPSLETVLLEGLGPFPVIKRIVGVEPVALPVHFEVCNLRDLVILDEKLSLGDQSGD